MDSIAPESNGLNDSFQWLVSPRAGNNFFGRLLNACNRIESKELSTAAVALTTSGNYQFIYNAEFFEAQPRAMQLMILVHEAGHLAFQHLRRFVFWREEYIADDPQVLKFLQPIFNIAMDMVVNDIALRPFLDLQSEVFEIEREKLVWPESKGYPKDGTVEEYFHMLVEDIKKDMKAAGGTGSGGGEGEEGDDPGQQGEGEGGGSGKAPAMNPENFPQWAKDMVEKQNNSHAQWQDLLDDMTEAEVERLAINAKREAQKMIKSAAEQTKKGRGVIPGALQKYIDELFEEPQVPWEQVFRGYMKSAISSNKSISTRMPNVSLYPLLVGDDDDADAGFGVEPYPGLMRNFTFHMVAMVDTSGSVSDKDYLMFLAEINGIMRAERGISLQFIMYDAAIQHEVLLGGRDSRATLEDNRSSVSRYGYGGTSFDPPFRRLVGVDSESDWSEGAEQAEGRIPKPDLGIMLTDGYAPMPSITPDCPVIWVLTSGGRADPAMGDRIIELNY